MKISSRIRITTKIVAPLVVVAPISAATARSVIGAPDSIQARSSFVADYLMIRLTGPQDVKIALGDAALMNRNILVGEPKADLADYRNRYDAAVRTTPATFDRRIAASRSEADRAEVVAIRGTTAPLFDIVARSNAAMQADIAELQRRIADGKRATLAEVDRSLSTVRAA